MGVLALAVLALSAAPGPSPPAARRADPVVAVRRDRRTGFSSLRVNEGRLHAAGRPVLFALRALCRYEPAEDRWRRVPWPLTSGAVRIVPLDGAVGAQERIAAHLPEAVGLFWVRWTEAPADRAVASATAVHEALATSGPIQCNDVDLIAPPAGRIAACVPFTDHAQARLVPAPPAGCEP